MCCGYTGLHAARQQVRAAVWPILNSTVAMAPNHFTFANKGVGGQPIDKAYDLEGRWSKRAKTWDEVLEKNYFRTG